MAPGYSRDTKDSAYRSSFTSGDSMPSAQIPSDDDGLTQVSVPPGSEKVVNIRRVNRVHGNNNNNTSSATTVPLSVVTGDHQSTMMERESQYATRVVLRHQKPQSKSKRNSMYRHQRKSQASMSMYDIPVTSATRRDISRDGGRVTSTLELEVNRRPRSMSAIPIQHGMENNTTMPSKETRRSTHRSSRMSLHREPELWLSPRVHESEEAKWRYSEIFGPEQHGHNKQYRKSSKKSQRASMMSQPQYIPTVMSPCVPMPVTYCPGCVHTCQQCVNVGSVNPEVLRQPPQSADWSGQPVDYNHRRSTAWSVSNVQPIAYQPQYSHQHSHHHHHSNVAPVYQHAPPPQTRNSMYRQPSRTVSHGSILNLSMEDLLNSNTVDLDDGPRALDVLEIEYATMLTKDGKRSSTHLSDETLHQIMELAKQCSGINEELEELAKSLKATLDKELGEAWNVVVGDDSFGSNVASLPVFFISYSGGLIYCDASIDIALDVTSGRISYPPSSQLNVIELHYAGLSETRPAYAMALGIQDPDILGLISCKSVKDIGEKLIADDSIKTVATASTDPATRSVFYIECATPRQEGRPIRYGQPVMFSLRLPICPSDGGADDTKTTSLYLASDLQRIGDPNSKTGMQPLFFEQDEPSFISQWRIEVEDPHLRKEYEGYPIRLDERVIITHMRTNKAMALEPKFRLRNMFGSDVAVSAKTYYDSHKLERDVNVWVLGSAVQQGIRGEDPQRDANRAALPVTADNTSLECDLARQE